MIVGNTARDSARLFRHFFAAYPVRSTLMLLAITAAALAEGVGIAALLPMIGLVIDAEGAGGALTHYVEQVFAFAGQNVSLGGLLVLIVVAMALKALLMLLAMAQVGYSAAHVAMDLRLAFIRAILRARWLHFVDRRTGDLASAVSVEPTRTADAYVAACHVLSGALQILIYLAVCMAISWEVSLLALAVGAFGMIALNRLVTMSRRAGQNQTDLQKSFMTLLLQGLDGMKPLKAMGREESMRPLFEGDVQGLNNAQRTIVISRETLAESYELIRAFAVAGGLYRLRGGLGPTGGRIAGPRGALHTNPAESEKCARPVSDRRNQPAGVRLPAVHDRRRRGGGGAETWGAQRPGSPPPSRSGMSAFPTVARTSWRTSR